MQKSYDVRPYFGAGNFDSVCHRAEAARIDNPPVPSVSPRSKSWHDSMGATDDREPEQQNDERLQGSNLLQ
jgi:hypothetical protein